MNVQKIIYSQQEVEYVARLLIQKLKTCKIFTFQGPLGAGKTTLIRQLLEQLGIKGEITSPTFTYLNVYVNDKQETFYHFDLYRIGSVDEFITAGFNEYLYQPNSWTLIEWPEVVAPLLTHDVCNIAIDYGQDLHTRELTIRCV
ncbi:MAG TPA: tRNA (adenosine(37)-N6)-threonylcarbamoyltransferase complex ATPase subunit type 1 TsaE [Candidatus Dependentiae bacterium]|nr:tRNA (adenosine(37)-N6)-threonylcarbamoyltransferase complex ATPase subunit type 1 TsaE [Candidatus Dependentiae bacterium]HRQ62240.1 tRNA (adenosine(37)-N6)-threonylcarbamoyltransferase complex ATPase subunit type 1 TsaE [Candidatus Dependentiae bacterium]